MKQPRRGETWVEISSGIKVKITSNSCGIVKCKPIGSYGIWTKGMLAFMKDFKRS